MQTYESTLIVKINLQLRISYLLFFLFLFKGFQTSAQAKYGDQAPEISLPSVNGDTLRLSELKGKVVLLDFWASWCGPCRVSNKELVKIYTKYKDKGFEIFGVSLDDNKKDWMRAIKNDRIKWQQVMDAGGFASTVAQRWFIYAIPTSFLIDKSGKLIAMDLSGKGLEKALKELL